MTKLIVLAIVIWGIFNTGLASVVFIAFYFLLELATLSSQLSAKGVSSNKLDESQNEVFRKYYTFFKYPLTSRNLSATLSLIQLSSFVWVPLCIYRHSYIQAGIIAINYLVAGYFAQQLNPQLFLSQADKKGDLKSGLDLILLESVLEVFYGNKDEKKNLSKKSKD